MAVPLQIKFRNMPASEAIATHVRQKAAKLPSFYDGIVGCRVVIEAPHRHHHKGKLYHVRIDIGVPGNDVVVNRDPSKRAAHGDVYVAIRDAFAAARRRLRDFARRQRGDVKLHESLPAARITKVFPEEGFGFMETADGREIYFHSHSVLEPGFAQIDVGTEVRFIEEQGAKGPQAASIRVIGKSSD